MNTPSHMYMQVMVIMNDGINLKIPNGSCWFLLTFTRPNICYAFLATDTFFFVSYYLGFNACFRCYL